MTRTLVVALLAGTALAVASGAVADSQATARPTLTIRSTQFGRILFDGRGQALYAFTRDKRGGKSQCYGSCAKAWPVYFKKGALRAGKGVKRSLIGTTRRRNGRLQITYNGRPLYFYAHEGRRVVKCQNVSSFGGLWLVMRPNGTLVR